MLTVPTIIRRRTYNVFWTPAQIPTALWLDADDASTVTLNGLTTSEWRDKSGNGRHATQATAANQPVWGRGQNLLRYSEQMDVGNPFWYNALPITPNAAVAPDGTLTADRFDSALGSTYQNFSCTPNTAYTFSFYLRLGTLAASDFKFAVRDDTNAVFIGVDLVPSVTPTSTGWTRVTYTFTTPAGCTLGRVYPFRPAVGNGNGTFFVWGAQVNIGATADAYQKTEAVVQSLRAGINGRATMVWPNTANGRSLNTTDNVPTRDVFFVTQFAGGAQATWLYANQGLFGDASGNVIGLIGDLTSNALWYNFSQYQNLRRNGSAQQQAGSGVTALPLPTAIINASEPTEVRNIPLAIGMDRNLSNLSRGWSGLIGEVIVLSSIASTETRQRVEGYLAWKWGLEVNLPAGHPYKLLPPTV